MSLWLIPEELVELTGFKPRSARSSPSSVSGDRPQIIKNISGAGDFWTGVIAGGISLAMSVAMIANGPLLRQFR
jgi:hypothetical protein